MKAENINRNITDFWLIWGIINNSLKSKLTNKSKRKGTERGTISPDERNTQTYGSLIETFSTITDVFLEQKNPYFPFRTESNKSTRFRLENTLYLTILQYGCNIWTVRKWDTWTLKTTEFKLYKRWAGYHLLHLKRNEDILEELGV